MDWLKEVVVDIITCLLIIIAVLINNSILNGIVIAYTALMLLIKVLVYFGGDTLNLMKKTQTSAPPWFPHLLYGINTGILFAYQWWYIAMAWALIWLFSYLIQRKLEK